MKADWEGREGFDGAPLLASRVKAGSPGMQQPVEAEKGKNRFPPGLSERTTPSPTAWLGLTP